MILVFLCICVFLWVRVHVYVCVRACVRACVLWVKKSGAICYNTNKRTVTIVILLWHAVYIMIDSLNTSYTWSYITICVNRSMQVQTIQDWSWQHCATHRPLHRPLSLLATPCSSECALTTLWAAEASELPGLKWKEVWTTFVSKKSVCLQCFCTRLGLSCWDVGCLTSQQQASVSQGQVCSDNFTCCHTETEVADPTFYLTQSRYTDTRPTSPSADPITPGAWQGSHWSANF